MRAPRLLLGLTSLVAASACGGAQATIGSSVGHEENAVAAGEAEPAREPEKKTEPPQAAAATAAEKAGEPVDPALVPPDPALVKALVEKTGESAAVDNELHGRLEITPRPAGERWLVAVVNRGTEQTKVLFDLRRLRLQLEQPEDPKKPRPKWQKKPAPRVCKLPDGFGGSREPEAMLTLEPGEGLVQTFDPRLYCITGNGESMLAHGQTLTAELGFTPKPPRTVWQHGKKTEQPAKQVAPFVVEPATFDPEHDTRVKQLVSSAFEVTDEMAGGETEEDTSLPLQLRLLRGSDASTERTATVTVEVRARGQKQTVYFRRELVSFTVHGPEGIRGCDPQPDDRAPDRQAYSSLGPGGSVSATGLLAELCPNLTFGRPGLYLVSARFDATRDGSEFGLRAFTGRLESRRQALVRISTGDLPALPPPEPLRVRVGG
jgi:hypothetical protein